jgi:hypothetical protein
MLPFIGENWEMVGKLISKRLNQISDSQYKHVPYGKDGKISLSSNIVT